MHTSHTALFSRNKLMHAEDMITTHLSGLSRSWLSRTKTGRPFCAWLIDVEVIHLVQAVLLKGPPFLSSYLYLIFYHFLPLPHQIPGSITVSLRVIFSCVSNFLTGIPLVGGKWGVEEPQWHQSGARCPIKAQHQAILQPDMGVLSKTRALRNQLLTKTTCLLMI